MNRARWNTKDLKRKEKNETQLDKRGMRKVRSASNGGGDNVPVPILLQTKQRSKRVEPDSSALHCFIERYTTDGNGERFVEYQEIENGFTTINSIQKPKQ
jgi:hypothetical protein